MHLLKGRACLFPRLIYWWLAWLALISAKVCYGVMGRVRDISLILIVLLLRWGRNRKYHRDFFVLSLLCSLLAFSSHSNSPSAPKVHLMWFRGAKNSSLRGSGQAGLYLHLLQIQRNDSKIKKKRKKEKDKLVIFSYFLLSAGPFQTALE